MLDSGGAKRDMVFVRSDRRARLEARHATPAVAARP